MKKILYSIIMVFSLSLMTSCYDEDSEDTSKITYYATLNLDGDASIFWSKDVPYVDPGYKAELKGEDVTSQVVIKGAVDVTKAGIYTLNYVITNPDGYSVVKSRTVLVSDPTPSPIESGYWTVTSESNRSYKGKIANFKDNFSVQILQTAPGVFYISDFLAGWYDQGAGYGSDYAMVGSFRLNDDNTIEVIQSSLKGWGDSLSSLANGKYNPATGEISYVAGYSNDEMKFNVTLTK